MTEIYMSIKSIFTLSIILLKYDVEIGRHSLVNRNIRFGKGCMIGKNTNLGCGVVLGNHVKIGSNVVLRNVSIDDRTEIEGGVRVLGHGEGRITIGSDCYIGINNILDFSDNITIGNFVHIAGPSTGIWTHSSAQQALSGTPLKEKNKENRPTSPVSIGNNVYIGGNTTIYPGVKIESYSIIAPNSAVVKNVQSNSMVGGVPAKHIKVITNG